MLANRGSISISNLSEKERKVYMDLTLIILKFLKMHLRNLVKNVSSFQKYLGSSTHMRII